MVRVSSPAKLRPCSESTAKMVMGVVPGLVADKDLEIGRLCLLLGRERNQQTPVRTGEGGGGSAYFIKFMDVGILPNQTHKHFFEAPRGTIVPGTNLTRPREK